MSSAKWLPFCLGLNVLSIEVWGGGGEIVSVCHATPCLSCGLLYGLYSYVVQIRLMGDNVYSVAHHIQVNRLKVKVTRVIRIFVVREEGVFS